MNETKLPSVRRRYLDVECVCVHREPVRRASQQAAQHGVDGETAQDAGAVPTGRLMHGRHSQVDEVSRVQDDTQPTQ